MDQSIDNQLQTKTFRSLSWKLIFILPPLLLAVVLLWYIAYQSLAARNFARDLNQLNDSLFLTQIGKNYSPPEEDDYIEKLTQAEARLASLRARKLLAESDSVRIVINLRDSMVFLEIRGLTVHAAKMLAVDFPPWFNELPLFARVAWLSEPFRTVRTYSTIPHEPIIIRHAPVDTIEAQSMPSTIPEPESKAVHFTYQTNQHLLIHVSQVSGDRIKTPFLIRFRRQMRDMKRIFLEMTGLTDRQYLATLKIYLSPQDAKTIFRALPGYPVGMLDY